MGSFAFKFQNGKPLEVREEIKWIKRDKIWLGVTTGLVIPIMGFGILLSIYDGLEQMDLLMGKSFSPTFRVRTLSLVSICLNIIPIQFFQKRHMYNSMRGLVFPTILYIILWLFYFRDILFPSLLA